MENETKTNCPDCGYELSGYGENLNWGLKYSCVNCGYMGNGEPKETQIQGAKKLLDNYMRSKERATMDFGSYLDFLSLERKN